MKSMSLQFGDNDVMGDCVKDLTEVISWSSLVHFCSHPITEGDQFGQAQLAPIEAVLAVSDHLLVFHVP